MKKILFLILFSSILLNLSACKSNNIPLDHKLEEFSFKLAQYASYNPQYLDQYYQAYQESNSYIYALNKVNYPFFLNPKTILPAFTKNNCLLVNRHFYLEKDYRPTTLVKVQNVNYVKRENETMLIDELTLKKYQEMEIFLKQKKVDLLIFSSFRSYEKQASLWNNPNANTQFLAQPGCSEHQTGLAIDIATKDSGLTIHFENTFAFQVLKENAHHFGFILRYPKDKETLTGYPYEPWHFRYVGEEIATIIYEHNLTLEEYFYNYLVLDF